MGSTDRAARLRETFTSKTPEVLLPVLRRHVLRQVNAVDPNRDQSYIHVSEMSHDDWCARRAWLRISGAPTSPVPAIGFSLAAVFEEGNFIHDKYQAWFWEMGILWGRFECLECEHRFFAQSPEECLVCGGRLKYTEVPLRSAAHHLIGHADAAVVLDGEVYLIEIKSVGLGTLRFEAPGLHQAYVDKAKTLEQVWMAVKRPFPSHRKQGAAYVTIGPESHSFLADVTKIIFIYEWKPSQEVREFVLDRDRLAGEIAELLEEARHVEVALRRGAEIDRPSWANPDGEWCKECAYRGSCWGEEVESSEPEERIITVAARSTAHRRRKALGSA